MAEKYGLMVSDDGTLGDNELSKDTDVSPGTEPGASRNSILIPTDSYEDIAKFLDKSDKTDALPGVGGSQGPSTGTIHLLKSQFAVPDAENSTTSDSDSEKKSGKALFTDVQLRLKPPDPIIARIETPTSLAGIDEENDGRNRPANENTINQQSNTNEVILDKLNGLNMPANETPSAAEEEEETAADWHSTEWRQRKKHVFILSFAGKPIYSRYGDEDRQASLMGAMQALVSFLQHSSSDSSLSDSLRSINAGPHRFVFLAREHVILVAASSIATSSHALFLTLSYAYNQIISVLTYKRLESIFTTRKNYDLRRLLGGSERFMDCLLDALDSDPCYFLGAVRCLPLDSGVRDVIGQTIAHYAKIKDLVFAILIADGQLISLVRLKKCLMHPLDLHMIFNLVTASDTFKHAESWTPICLPKFDSSGYLHAHISYLDEECHTCLLLLTVDKDLFFQLSDCREKIREKLIRNNCCKAIDESLKRYSYTVRELGIPDVWHFLYKSRSTTQLTSPEYTAPYSRSEERARLFSVYQSVHDRMHSSARPLKILFHVGKFEAVLGWITSGFELYAVFSPLVSKPTAIASTSQLLRWIKKEEDRLFIMNSPTI